MQGTIKKLVTDKYFGFISQEGSDKDVFFHKDKLEGVTFEELKEGDILSFEVEQGQRGPSAINIKRV
ncbi:MAG: cold shock domain-containing protein [Candidatus Buchananbacteria bacterium]